MNKQLTFLKEVRKSATLMTDNKSAEKNDLYLYGKLIKNEL